MAHEVVDDEATTPLVRYPSLIALARLRIRRGDPSAGPVLDEMKLFLDKGMELQRLAPFAEVMAELAWLGEGDRDEALRLIALADSLAPTRAVFGALPPCRRLADHRQSEREQGGGNGHTN